MRTMTMQQLQIALLALLPKDGGARTATWLAETAGVTTGEVSDALMSHREDRQVSYDLPTDSYSLLRYAR